MRDERVWVPVEVLWDEQTPGAWEPRQERAWEPRREQSNVRPIDRGQAEERTRRARLSRDDAADATERSGERRRRGDARPRRNKFRFDDFEDEDY